MSAVLDDKDLRKAWLKRKFASWEYHEELLKLHDEYLTAMHRHWSDEGRQKRHPDTYHTMKSPVFLNFDKVEKPGTTPKRGWKAGKQVGWADAISYNFNRGLGDMGADFNEYEEMDDAQRAHLNDLVAQMLRHCQNIKYTVDNRWEYKGSDDYILDESYTDPIDWPVNWRDDVADLAKPPVGVNRCEAGEPCPHEGFWFTPAKANSRRYFMQGETMPSAGGDYGATIWQWDESQRT
jgi:hypothetical protein